MATLLQLTVIVLFITVIALYDTQALCDAIQSYSSYCIDPTLIYSMQLSAGVALSVKNHKKLKKQKPVKLSQQQVDAVVGMTHSDVHIEQRPKGSRLKICQGHKQKDLVFHLFDLFDGLVGAEPRNYVTTLVNGRVRNE